MNSPARTSSRTSRTVESGAAAASEHRCLGLGEHAIADTPGQTLKIMGLGSCVALIVMEPATGIVGMAHVVLPDSSAHPERRAILPGYFADTAVSTLVTPWKKQATRLIIKLVGGASMFTSERPMIDSLEIGKRNALALKKSLWKQGLGPLVEDLGGTESRTVTATFGSAVVTITRAGIVRSEV